MENYQVTQQYDHEVSQRPQLPEEYYDLKTKIHDRMLDLIDLSVLEDLQREEASAQIQGLVERILHTDGFGVPLNSLERELLISEIEDEILDLRFVFENMRRFYYSILMLIWVWSALTWPVFAGVMGPTTPFFVALFIISAVLVLSKNSKVHAVLVSANLLALALHVALFAMRMGAAAAQTPASGG